MRRKKNVEDSVNDVAEDDFVDMDGEGVQVKEVGEGFNCIAEGGRDRARIQHRLFGGVGAGMEDMSGRGFRAVQRAANHLVEMVKF